MPSGTAAGLNFTIPSLPRNTALRFSYQAQMPATSLSAENCVSVTPQSSPGVTSFSAGAAGAHANVQVRAAAPVAEVLAAIVPTLDFGSLLALVCAMLAVAGIVFARRPTRQP